NIAEKRQAYTKFMSQQLKDSYPTAVLAEQVKREELPLDRAMRNGVANFLEEHQNEFKIGEQTLLQFIDEKDLSLEEHVVIELKRLERVYQIAQSDTVMKLLMDSKIDSAHKIVRFGKKQTVKKLTTAGMKEEDANLVYSKAHQVHSTVMNIATGYVTYMQTPPIYALNYLHPLYNREPESILAFPTLGELI